MNIAKLKMDITAEKKMLARCNNILRGLPKGKLNCYTKNGKKYYKQYENNKQKYLGKEENIMVQKLKKRHLLEEMIRILDHNIAIMEQLTEEYKNYDPCELQRHFSKAYQNVPADIIHELGYVTNAEKSSFYEENKIYRTTSGLLVRSRIEALIADMYINKGISFEYETALYFQDGSVVHPDFKVYCPSNDKYMYHEHIGLLSDDKYLKNYIWKIEHYISNGYYPFYDVLFTYEKPGKGVDLNEISLMIDIFMK